MSAVITSVWFHQVVALNSPNGADVPLRTYSTNHLIGSDWHYNCVISMCTGEWQIILDDCEADWLPVYVTHCTVRAAVCGQPVGFVAVLLHSFVCWWVVNFCLLHALLHHIGWLVSLHMPALRHVSYCQMCFRHVPCCDTLADSHRHQCTSSPVLLHVCGGTAAAVPVPFRPSEPALCGRCPLVTPY